MSLQDANNGFGGDEASCGFRRCGIGFLLGYLGRVQLEAALLHLRRIGAVRELVYGSDGGQRRTLGLHGLHENVTGVLQRRKRYVVAVGIERVADGTAARIGARVGDGAGDGEVQFGRRLTTLNRVIDRKTCVG